MIPWGQTTLILATIAFFMEGKMFRLRTAAGPLLMVFSAIVALSSLTAFDPGYAIANWELFYSWVLIYLLITNTITTEKRFFVFLLAFLLYSFKMSQHGFRVWATRGFGFAGWGLAGPGGWFQNSGELAIRDVRLPAACGGVRPRHEAAHGEVDALAVLLRAGDGSSPPSSAPPRVAASWAPPPWASGGWRAPSTGSAASSPCCW